MQGAESYNLAGFRALALPVLAMALVVTASNVLVQYPFDVGPLAEWLTWGAWSYPFALFVTDLTNRSFGPVLARRVVLVGFVLAVVLSVILATPRIALASGAAFAAAQLLDVGIFHRLRNRAWWIAPAASTAVASTVDTALFFGLAFWGEDVGSIVYSVGSTSFAVSTWVQWAVGDLAVKALMACVLILPYRHIMLRWRLPIYVG